SFTTSLKSCVDPPGGVLIRSSSQARACSGGSIAGAGDLGGASARSRLLAGLLVQLPTGRTTRYRKPAQGSVNSSIDSVIYTAHQRDAFHQSLRERRRAGVKTDNYWIRRMTTRRGVLRGTALGGIGLATAAAVGCGDDSTSSTK